MWMTLLYGGMAALFLAITIATLRSLRWVGRLPAWESFTTPAPIPARVSVVIAARDEEARIEGTLRHLLAQRGVDAEVIVVDDRSTDRTNEVLKRIAREDARVKVKRVEALPEGWLGKCHACHVGASVATGDWILFTDADCWLKPDVIARALQVAERDGADHISMTPGTVIEGFGARAWHVFITTTFLDLIAGVNRDKPRAYFGIGAFNLVRTTAYRDCGGHEALRLTVVDDMKLGLLLSRAGKRTRGFLGMGDVECHWGTTLRGMVKIMEKNYFAAMDYRLGLALAASAVWLIMTSLVVSGLFSGTVVGVVAGLSPLAMVLPSVIVARRLGWSWLSAVGMPFMAPVFVYTLLNSTLVTVRQGGIRWRETFYPLETLRKGNVR